MWCYLTATVGRRFPPFLPITYSIRKEYQKETWAWHGFVFTVCYGIHSNKTQQTQILRRKNWYVLIALSSYIFSYQKTHLACTLYFWILRNIFFIWKFKKFGNARHHLLSEFFWKVRKFLESNNFSEKSQFFWIY